MTTKELYKQRIMPALNQMYEESENIFGITEKLSYDDIISHCERDENDRHRYLFPFTAFYLPEERQKEIIKEAKKRLRYSWRFPYRTEFIYSDREIKKMQKTIDELTAKGNLTSDDEFEIKIMQEKIKYNERHKKTNALGDAYIKEITDLWDRFEKKEMTRKEYNKEFEGIAKKYNCTKYSSDGNAVSFELAFCGPNSYDVSFNELKEAFNEWKNNPEILNKKIEEPKTKEEIRMYRIIIDLKEAVSFYQNYKEGRTNEWQRL